MMKEILRAAFMSICLLLFGFLIGLGTGRIVPRRTVAVRVDTLSILKEMVDSEAILVAKMPKGYELTPVGSVDSLKRLADRPERVITEEVEKPVIIVRDSLVYIHVPMEERVFSGRRDSVDYRVKTTGYNVSLDDVWFRYPETVVTRTERVVRNPRIGFGMALGPSVLLTPTGKIHGGVGASAGVYVRF